VPTTRLPRADVAALFPQLADLARRTTRLHPRRSADLPRRASKLGGEILWPATEPWPICPYPVYGPESPMCIRSRESHPYVPVLQLRADEYPELGFPPGRDLFQLLW
jgi:hypothetical protein